jgi:hypothetical protein
LNLLFIVSAFCFLIAALAPIFDWALGDFNAIAWGLFALVVGMLWAYEVPVGRRNRA